MTRTRRTIAIATLAAAFALAACGGDDGDAGASGNGGDGDVARTEAGAGDGSHRGSSDAAGGDGDWLADLGLDHKGEALVGRVAERYEVIDDVLHLHVGEEPMAPAGTECMIVSGVLSDGETGVIHRADGSEETC